ncbi:hypothetical protein GUJ93_ZPchr0004g39232 [Zizania palustris]|uniref:Uncharacterized protein n=1 Tax=Zizania palustris TaxID=103762 RepID=A0A8J5VFW5_ZIZPA|nr:hypothetical protein GUJ93_ZPchr0004g39232 [Zizania palustris]
MEGAISNLPSRRVAVVTGGNKGIGLEVNNAAIVGMECIPEIDSNKELFDGMDKQQRIEWMNKQVQQTYDAAKNGVQTNFYGATHNVNNEDLKNELDDVDNLTEEWLDELLDKFLKDFKAGMLEAHGWPTTFAAYKMAKVAMNAYTRMLARRHPSLCINRAHPGYVKTDLTMNSGFLTTEEGGRNIVTVVLQPDGGPTGAFFDEGREASFA